MVQPLEKTFGQFLERLNIHLAIRNSNFRVRKKKKKQISESVKAVRVHSHIHPLMYYGSM